MDDNVSNGKSFTTWLSIANILPLMLFNVDVTEMSLKDYKAYGQVLKTEKNDAYGALNDSQRCPEAVYASVTDPV